MLQEPPPKTLWRTLLRLIIKMARTLHLDAQIPQQEKDFIFHDIEQDNSYLPSLSSIPALFDLVKTSWDKSPSTLQVPHKIQHHYKTHGSDSEFLIKHPMPNSIIVEATQYKSHNRSTITPVNKEGKKTDSLSKKTSTHWLH